MLSAIVLLGPTASGKTDIALKIAQKYPIEIISLDSALIYKNMDIGTAKPSIIERKHVKHHLIDIISPLESYSAAHFMTDCSSLIREINQRKKIPLIVGGTMMYYHALTSGLNQLPQANPIIREEIQNLKQKHGIHFLYQKLKELDLQTALRLAATDTQRIERALEVYFITKKPMSELINKEELNKPLFHFTTIALLPEPRSILHEKIKNRFYSMIESGFIEEVISLKTQYPELTLNHPAMRCVGYRQIWEYLDHTLNYSEMIDKSIIATRQLAKRQLTWLKKVMIHHSVNPYNKLYHFSKILDEIQEIFEDHISKFIT